jgi:hypothetical protein
MLLSLYLDRAYFIDHSKGFRLSEYYDGLNHNIPWSKLLPKASNNVAVVDFQGNKGRVRCVTMFEQLEKFRNSPKHIGFRTNQDCFKDIHMHYESLKPGLLARSDTLTLIYNYLFKPVPTFFAVIQHLTDAVRSKDEFNSLETVCTHIRTGKIKGGSDPLRQGKKGGFVKWIQTKIIPCAKMVAANNIGMTNKKTKTRFFVAADNTQALSVFKNGMGVDKDVVDGSSVKGLDNVIHLARSGSSLNKAGILRMLGDFEVFRRSCDYIVLAPSTFSSVAFVASFLNVTFQKIKSFY